MKKQSFRLLNCLALAFACFCLVSCAESKVVTQGELPPDYYEIVKNEGSAANLIFNTTDTKVLQDILQHLIRESNAGLKAWEKQLTSQYIQENTFHPNRKAIEAIKTTREVVIETQGNCTEKLFQAKVDTEDLKSKLTLLDRLTTSLAAKTNRSRPLLK